MVQRNLEGIESRAQAPLVLYLKFVSTELPRLLVDLVISFLDQLVQLLNLLEIEGTSLLQLAREDSLLSLERVLVHFLPYERFRSNY